MFCMAARSGFCRRVGLFTAVKVDLGGQTQGQCMRMRVKGPPCSGSWPLLSLTTMMDINL